MSNKLKKHNLLFALWSWALELNMKLSGIITKWALLHAAVIVLMSRSDYQRAAGVRKLAVITIWLKKHFFFIVLAQTRTNPPLHQHCI